MDGVPLRRIVWSLGAEKCGRCSCVLGYLVYLFLRIGL